VTGFPLSRFIRDMSPTAKVYLAVMPSGQIEFSIEGPMVGGQVLNAFYLRNGTHGRFTRS
jgi:hypothetical protein